MRSIQVFALFCASMLLFTACRRNEPIDPITDQDRGSRGSKVMQAAAIAQQVMTIVSEQAQQNPALGGLTPPNIETCPEVTVTPALPIDTFPKTATFDFGSGCTYQNGATVSGVITAVFSGPVDAAGTTIAITCTNLNINGYSVSGDFAISVTPSPGAVERSMTMQITNGVFSDGTNTITIVDMTLELSQTAGVGTSDTADDVVELDFDGTCKNAEGTTYTVSTTATIVKKGNCEWPDSGTLSITLDDKTGTIDFGSGTCDNEFTVSVGNFSDTFEFP